MRSAPIAAFAMATLLAVPAVLLPIAMVLSAILSAAGSEVSGASDVAGSITRPLAGDGSSFRGGESLGRTLAWTASIGAAAALVGWLPGRRLAEGRSAWVAVATLLPLLLPGWLLFHGFWTAIGPGTTLGDLASRHEAVRPVREAALVVGLLAACWPLAAWSVAIERVCGVRTTAALEAVDGLPWTRRWAIALREDGPALLRGGLAAMLLLCSTTVAFDLAGVRTFGFELRTLDAEGVPPTTILALGWPGLVPGVVLMLLAWTLPASREGATAERSWRRSGRAANLLIALLVGGPLGLLAWGLFHEPGIDAASLRAFAILHGPSVMPTLATAAVAAGLAALLAGALVLSWTARSRVVRIGLAVEALAWTVAAGMPSAVLAAAVIELWNRPGVDWVHRSPAILVLGLFARFGVVAVATAWWIARRRPLDERRLAEIDGPRRLGELLRIERSRVAAAMVGTFAAVGSLSLGEVALSSRLAPPGDAWLATAILNAIHYQRGETVLISALVLVLVGMVAALLLRASVRPVGSSRLALLAVATAGVLATAIPGCGEGGSSNSSTPSNATVGEGIAPVPAEFAVGGQGTVPGRFRTPRAVAFAPGEEALLVVDRTGRLQKVAIAGPRKGRATAVWPLPEFDMGFPTGITVVGDRIVVADTHEHRVLVLDAEGGTVETFGGYGTAAGEFVYPTDVVALPDGRMFVGEYGGNDRIQLFDAAWRPLLGFDASESGIAFRRPQSLALSPAGDELFVADSCNHRIVVVDLEGRVRRVLGELGREPGRLAYPYGIAFDGRGGLLVAEFGNNRLQRLDPKTGESLGCWGGFGEEMGRLRYPWSVAVRDGRVAVLDSGNHRMMLFEIDALLVPPGGSGDGEESLP